MQNMPLIQRMAEYEPVEWKLIPDLGLYMDQVLTYLESQLEPLYGAQAKGLITPSMINNYVKNGLLNRPQGKKYYREQLALLMIIVTLKPVASSTLAAKALQSSALGPSVPSIFLGRPMQISVTWLSCASF